jgi:hypothetical protein
MAVCMKERPAWWCRVHLSHSSCSRLALGLLVGLDPSPEGWKGARALCCSTLAREPALGGGRCQHARWWRFCHNRCTPTCAQCVPSVWLFWVLRGPDPIPVDRHHAALAAATEADTIPLIWVWNAFRPRVAEGGNGIWGFVSISLDAFLCGFKLGTNDSHAAHLTRATCSVFIRIAQSMVGCLHSVYSSDEDTRTHGDDQN